jgi:hypothetical protein
MTVSAAGFSEGRLGAVMDATSAWQVFWAVFGGAADPLSSFLDANASTPPTQLPLADCDGMSATLVIGGVAE